MSKTSTESLNTTTSTSQSASITPQDAPKNTATIFNPAMAQEQGSSDSSQPYHHKANHNQNRSITQSSDAASVRQQPSMHPLARHQRLVLYR